MVRDKDNEQQMMRELADFAHAFSEKYGVLLYIKLKPRKWKEKEN